MRSILLQGMRHGWPDPYYIMMHWTWQQLLEYSEGLLEMIHGVSDRGRGRSVDDATPEYLRSIANYIEG
ncbi:MAG: hypothetical protein HDKAJFGB_03052 [Anaerolineae bacterium]|nr:hypothetical protein [Anaerolineae bacterium]